MIYQWGICLISLGKYPKRVTNNPRDRRVPLKRAPLTLSVA